MNILFITLMDIRSMDEKNIYIDLMREFVKHGHNVFIVSPAERRTGIRTGFINEGIDVRYRILKIRTGNVQKTNIIEKGISTVLLEYCLEKGIRKYFRGIHFDLVLYSTPPVTLIKPIQYIKKRDNARTYLLLKDIFPQNAVDLGIIKTTGIKGLLYRYFKKKEKKLYSISDRIGCMSQANVDYVVKHNSDINPSKVEICPNCIEVQDMRITDEERYSIRERYGIPQNKKVFIYGGNLGRPQGIPFIIECLKAQESNDDVYFLIIGDGTEYRKLKAYYDEARPSNMRLMKQLPKEDYDRVVAACDVGMIFLDHRFTIPNFPSRLLSYMQAGLPILACTDPNTDIGRVIVDGGFGWWCESDNVECYNNKLIEICKADMGVLSQNARAYLLEHYNAKIIFEKFEQYFKEEGLYVSGCNN